MRRPDPRPGLPALALLGCGLLACAEPAWDLPALERRHPALARVDGHRLAEVRPYYWPAGDRLTLFLCRWPDGSRIPVVLPKDASAAERAQLEAALQAWEEAGLGVRFERRDALEGVGIEMRLLDGMLSYAANTVADCALDAEAAARGADPLPARMVLASIHLARGDPRLAGSALHELGHALGFQGHPTRGDTAMRTGAANVRRAGERAQRGEHRPDAALAALYAVPSGTVLARRALPAGRSADVDALLARARQQGWIGPLLRVGDREGRVAWLDGRGRPVSLVLSGLQAALDDPARLRVERTPRAAELLGPGG